MCWVLGACMEPSQVEQRCYWCITEYLPKPRHGKHIAKNCKLVTGELEHNSKESEPGAYRKIKRRQDKSLLVTWLFWFWYWVVSSLCTSCLKVSHPHPTPPRDAKWAQGSMESFWLLVLFFRGTIDAFHTLGTKAHLPWLVSLSLIEQRQRKFRVLRKYVTF